MARGVAEATEIERPKGKVRVRCLGPREQEHYFLSADPCRERICRRCRRTMQEYPAGRLGREPPMNGRRIIDREWEES